MRPRYDLDLARERLSNVIRTYYDISMPEEWRRIISGVFHKYGLTDGNEIPQERLRSHIAAEIGERIASHTLSIPFEETLSKEQLRVAFDGYARKPAT